MAKVRLIDAGELLHRIKENSYTLVDIINSKGNGMFLNGIEQAINSAPTIEAEPVNHAKWLTDSEGEICCSNCGHYSQDRFDERFENELGKGWALKNPYYCGYCGSKMDLKEGE